MTELTVILIGEDTRYTQKFLLYEAYQFTEHDEVIQSCIKQAREAFKQDVTDIKIRATMSL